MATAQAGIKITADISQYARAIQQAEAVTSRTLGNINGLLGSLGFGISAVAAIAFTKSIIDAADALNDLEKRTGISVERLSAWRLASEQSGTSIDSLAGALGKAGKYMVEHGDNLKAIGITGKTAEETMIQLAGVIASLPADDPRRVALAMEVLGKSAGDLLPLLSEGEAGLRKMLQRGQELTPITSEFAKNADELNDQLAVLKIESSAFGVVIGERIVPGLITTSKELTRLVEQGDLLTATFRGLAGAGKAFWDLIIPEQKYSASNQLDEMKTKLLDLQKIQRGESGVGFFQSRADVNNQATVLQYQIAAFERMQKKNPLDVAYDAHGMPSSQKVNNAALDSFLKSSDEAANAAKKAYEMRQQLAQAAAKDYAELLKSAQALTAAEETKAQSMQRTLDDYTSLNPAVRQYVQAQIDAAKSLEDETHWREVMNDSLDREIELRNSVDDALRAEADARDSALSAYAEEMRRAQEDLNIEMLGSDRERVLAQIALEKVRKIDYLRSLDDQTEATHAAIEAMIADTEQYYGSKVAKVNLEEQRDVWKSIESTAHDTFISIFDSGKSAFDRLKDTLKNGLLDLLYQMTIKKWIFNIGASVTGTSAAGSALAAGEVAGIPTGGAGVVDTILGGFKSINTNFTDTISQLGTKLIDNGFDTLGNTIATNSELIGQLAPFAGAAFSLFKGDLKGAAIQGIGAALSFTPLGPLGGFIGSTILGGLFGGSKKVPHPEVAASAQLDNGVFKSVNRVSKHLASDSIDPFLQSSLGAYADFVKALGGKETKPLYLAASYNQKANQTRIGAVNPFVANADDQTSVSNAVKAAILDGIKSGTTDLPKYLQSMLAAATITTENASALMEAMAGFKQLRDALTGMPVVFAKIATAIDSGFIPSMEAAQSLIQSTSAYYDAYYPEAERLALAQQGIANQFTAMGVTLPATKDGFRALVEGLDTSTERGVALYAALMQIAPGFAQVQDAAIAAAAANAQAQAELMAQRQGWQEQLDVLTGARTQTQIERTNHLASTTDDATKSLMQQVFAQQDLIDAAAAKQLADEQAAAAAQQAAQAQAEAAQRIKDTWQGIADSVLGEVQRLRGQVMGSSPNSLLGAQSAFAIATAQARAGDQAAASSLPELSSKLDDLYRLNSETSADYRLALARQAASLLTTMDTMRQYGITVPGFAAGGNFAGGWRVVGERGAELEATGQARIFNASQTAGILSGTGNNEQLRADLQKMTQQLEIMTRKLSDIERGTTATAKATNGRPDAPMLVEVAA